MNRVDYLKNTLNEFRVFRDDANKRVLNSDYIRYEGAAYLFKLDDKARHEENVDYWNRRIYEILLELRDIEH